MIMHSVTTEIYCQNACTCLKYNIKPKTILKRSLWLVRFGVPIGIANCNKTNRKFALYYN